MVTSKLAEGLSNLRLRDRGRVREGLPKAFLHQESEQGRTAVQAPETEAEGVIDVQPRLRPAKTPARIPGEPRRRDSPPTNVLLDRLNNALFRQELPLPIGVTLPTSLVVLLGAYSSGQ